MIYQTSYRLILAGRSADALDTRPRYLQKPLATADDARFRPWLQVGSDAVKLTPNRHPSSEARTSTVRTLLTRAPLPLN